MKKRKDFESGTIVGGDRVITSEDQKKPVAKVSTLCIGKGLVKGCERDISLCNKCTPAKEFAVEWKGLFQLLGVAEQLGDHAKEAMALGDVLEQLAKDPSDPQCTNMEISTLATRSMSLACGIHFDRRDLFYNLLYRAMVSDHESY